ncbi:MAG: glycosyltransferase family 2 protein [Candidatus Latescibacteria bacterium]|nr:glycosyltransferase family 2 protein [Candidatus Latescibacterota bacterium]
MLISVIIPALNEADSIQACLAQFDQQDDLEVLVVDGGSTDGTLGLVESSDIGRCITAPEPGRAMQMNFGAQQATGDVLLFLHADTFLPLEGLDLIRQTLVSDDVVGGRFELGLAESNIGFRLIAYMSTLRSRYLGITYGDQGIFVRREIFDSVRGYPLLLLFEDSEFCTLVARRGTFVMLPAQVRSSTRRWHKWGVARTVIWMWLLRVLFTCGVSDKTLCRWYRAVR